MSTQVETIKLTSKPCPLCDDPEIKAAYIVNTFNFWRYHGLPLTGPFRCSLCGKVWTEMPATPAAEAKCDLCKDPDHYKILERSYDNYPNLKRRFPMQFECRSCGRSWFWDPANHEAKSAKSRPED